MKSASSIFKIDKNGFTKPLTLKKAPASDRIFLLLVIILSIFGTVMVFSAGSAYAYARYDDGGYFIKKQVMNMNSLLLISESVF